MKNKININPYNFKKMTLTSEAESDGKNLMDIGSE